MSIKKKMFKNEKPIIKSSSIATEDPARSEPVASPYRDNIDPPVFTSLGRNPEIVTCLYCHQLVTTRVVTRISKETHSNFFCMCRNYCWCCCLLPYCIPAFKAKKHYCPNCQAYLGTCKPLLE